MKTRRLILAGGSGFLGQALSHYFSESGWEVVVLTRTSGSSADDTREAIWDGETLGDWARELEGASALINLSGRSVNCRYHARNRRLMMDSRINSTRVLGEAIARCKNPPQVWINSSTATIYRHTFGPAWDESGEIGASAEAKDELSVEIATAWEREFNKARTANTWKVALRSAMVLGRGGNSVFPALRNLARFGFGGAMAGGGQFVSWVHEKDFCRAVEWTIARDELNGVINVAAPNPVTNAEMMRSLREVCCVPIGLPATRWMLEIGAFIMRTETELVIKSRRVISSRLPASGFRFAFPEIKCAFQDLANERTPEDAAGIPNAPASVESGG